jgi:hypothetical protein
VDGVVEVYRLDGPMVRDVTVEAEPGTWTIDHLLPGWYKIRFRTTDER